MLVVPPAHQLMAGIAIVTLVLLFHYRRHRNRIVREEISHD
jgi:hypothetical protein